MKPIIAIIISLSSTLALASVEVTHIVGVKEGYSTEACAVEINEKTSVDVVDVLTRVRIITIKSSDREAARVAKLSCVESVEKDEPVILF